MFKHKEWSILVPVSKESVIQAIFPTSKRDARRHFFQIFQQLKAEGNGWA